jgi:hypothetical protein
MPRTQVTVVVAALAALSVGLLGSPALELRSPRVEDDPVFRFAGDEDFLRQEADLDARLATAVSRLSDKWAVALALVRGELSLRQAVDRFRVIMAGDPAFFDQLRRSRPGATDDELLYRNVVGYARNVLTEWPDHSPDMLDRLEAELDAEFPAGDGRTGAGAS